MKGLFAGAKWTWSSMMIIVVIIVIVMITETVKVYILHWHYTLADWFASFKTPMSTEEERRKKNWRRQSKKRRSRVKREVDELAHWTECEMGWMMMTMMAWHRGGGGTMAWYPMLEFTYWLKYNVCVCKRKVMRRSPPEMEWFFYFYLVCVFGPTTSS